MQVTTGTVDLATSTFSQGSRSQVVVAGARASFSSETSAHVMNDPRGDIHEIQVNKGSWRSQPWQRNRSPDRL